MRPAIFAFALAWLAASMPFGVRSGLEQNIVAALIIFVVTVGLSFCFTLRSWENCFYVVLGMIVLLPVPEIMASILVGWAVGTVRQERPPS